MGGRHVLRNGPVAASGLKVLADGGDINVGAGNVVEKPVNLLGRLAQTDHETGLGEGFGTVLFGKTKHVERLLVIGLGPHTPVEAPDGLHVVVKNVRAGIEYPGDGLEVAAKVWGQNFNARVGICQTNLPDGLGKVDGAAIGEFVAIDRSNDDITELHDGGHLGNVPGLVRIELELLLGGRALGDGAKGTAARAQVTQNHEGSGPAMKALVDVWTAGRLADGVEAALAQIGLQLVDRLEMSTAFPEPLRQAAGHRKRLRRLDLDKRSGRHEASLSHCYEQESGFLRNELRKWVRIFKSANHAWLVIAAEEAAEVSTDDCAEGVALLVTGVGVLGGSEFVAEALEGHALQDHPPWPRESSQE